MAILSQPHPFGKKRANVTFKGAATILHTGKFHFLVLNASLRISPYSLVEAGHINWCQKINEFSKIDTDLSYVGICQNFSLPDKHCGYLCR